jgi:hypothetical protein
MWYYPHTQSISVQYLTSLVSSQLLLAQNKKKQLIRIGRTVFHEKKNGQRRYKYIFLERDTSYFVKKNKKTHSSSTKKFADTDIIKMLAHLIDNIFVMFGLHSYRYQLFSTSIRLVPLFIRSRLHTRGFSRKTKRS